MSTRNTKHYRSSGPPVIPLSFSNNTEHTSHCLRSRAVCIITYRWPACARSPIVLHSINNVRILIENYFKNVIDQNKRDRSFYLLLCHCILFNTRGPVSAVGTKSQLRWPLSSWRRSFCCHARALSISSTPNSDRRRRDKSNRGNRSDIGHPGSSLVLRVTPVCLRVIVERYTINQMKALLSAIDANGTDSFPAVETF